MDRPPIGDPGPDGAPSPPSSAARRAWHSVRARMLAGLLLVLPVLITFWLLFWLFSTLQRVVIGPLARVVVWKVRGGQPDAELPAWFESYAAPLVAVLVVLGLLYGLGFFAHSRLRGAIDWVLLRVPGVSVVYNGVRKVVQTLETRPGRDRPQRVVLVPFPHPGMKAPAFVTGSCRDIETGRLILCVYVPTTPVPTSGYFLLVPEEDVTELNWTSEEALQAIISAGLTAPPEVRYFPAGDSKSPGRLFPGLAPPAGLREHGPS